MLWSILNDQIESLRPAFSRQTTFLWFVLWVMAFSIRCGDLSGVTSTVRCLGLLSSSYPCLLNFYHSDAIDLAMLTKLWTRLALKIFTSKVMVNGRLVLLIDGIKVAKEGRKMPGVKSLHQDSDSNSKAEYIMGHSLQAVTLLVKAGMSYFAVPLACRIHEGFKDNNAERKTLIDKIYELIISLGIDVGCYVVGDAYYGAAGLAADLVGSGHHLVTRVKTNAVAYKRARNSSKKKRGRKKKYGTKVKLYSIFNKTSKFITVESPIYGEKNVSIQYYSEKLIWRSYGKPILYVWAIHPTRGKIVLITTDLEMSPLDLIKLYGKRFKIEVSFKQSLHTLGAYAYHFWLKSMEKIKKKDGDQDMSHVSEEYREKVLRKMRAYHVHILIGLIAQGLLQYLSVMKPEIVWKQFGSWIRTIRPGISPSEHVTATALRNSLPEFLLDLTATSIVKKFLMDRIDLSRVEGQRFAA